MGSRFSILPNGSIKENEQTPEEKKDFLIFYAGVLEREAEARAPSSFSDDLRAWAVKARAEAEAIDLRPAQGDLFL